MSFTSESSVAAAQDVAEAKHLVEPHLDPQDWTTGDWGALANLGDSVARAKNPLRLPNREVTLEPPKGPVLIEGCDFDLGPWSQTALSRLLGESHLLLNGSTNSGTPVSVPCTPFLEYMAAQNGVRGGRDLFTLCVFDRRVLHSGSPPAYLPPSFARDRLLERLPDALRPDTRWLLLGPARSGTGIHTDPVNTGAWNTVASGVKRWAMLSPGVAAELAEQDTSPDGVDWTVPDWFLREWPSIATKAAATGHTALDFIQRPGETVYVPPGWWHAVLNVESSVALTENFVRAGVLQAAIDGSTEGKVVQAVVDALGLVDEAGGVQRWLRGMHLEGLVRLPDGCLKE